ncbi:hypothetical protein Btru_017634 [Bulinus truncatus]|nr:hypothetical protein Btru_017634 [Bulinus truncatus]
MCFEGTLISGHRPLGVISGSCYSFQLRRETCKTSEFQLNRDLAVGEDEKGGPSIMQIVPNHLFYSAYVWIRPNDMNVTHYMVLVLQTTDDLFTMTWNDTEFSRSGGQTEYVTNSKYTVTFEKEITSVWDYGVLQADVPFGCYFLGLGHGNGSFMHPAGFVFSYEKQPECVKQDQSPADGIDNDCDGSVDEEFVNDIGKGNVDISIRLIVSRRYDHSYGLSPDDDGDGLKDEDTYNVTTTECKEENKWGKDCQYTCSEYCKEDCMKENGACVNCAAGRQEPRYFCNKDCDAFTFGLNCSGDCRWKCNQKDCYERVTGACAPSEREVSEPPDTTVATYPPRQREPKEEGSSLLSNLLFILIVIAAATTAYIAIVKSQEKPVVVIEERKPSTHVVQERIIVWDEEAIRMKRRRSGSNVDEPDEYNRDYMMKHSSGRFWKYIPLLGSWPGKQEQQAPAPTPVVETPQTLTSMMGSAMGQLAADPTAMALTSLVESAVSPLVQAAEPAAQTLTSLVEAAVGEAQEGGIPTVAAADAPAKTQGKSAASASDKASTLSKEQGKLSSKPSTKAPDEPEIIAEESARASTDKSAPDVNDFTKVEIDES